MNKGRKHRRGGRGRNRSKGGGGGGGGGAGAEDAEPEVEDEVAAEAEAEQAATAAVLDAASYAAQAAADAGVSLPAQSPETSTSCAKRSSGKPVKRPPDNPPEELVEDPALTAGLELPAGDRPFIVQNSDVMGRYLVAARDLRPGEVIIREEPLVVGPSQAFKPFCVGCYQRLDDGGASYRCERCGWPLCGAACAGAALHAAECRLMQERGFRAALRFLPAKKESAFCSIVPLRCLLLKERDPAKYQALMSLQSHLEERKDTPLYAAYRHNIVGFIRSALRLTQFDEALILTVAGILDTNAFEIRRGGTKARGVYPTAALMAHDCTPNTKHVFTGPEFTIKVIATVPIRKGDMITTSYTQALWGTQARRSHLKMAKCFDCACRRCTDPTELGTYIGAISCSKCKDLIEGISDPDNESKIISTDPLDSAAPWKCETCAHTLPSRQISWGNDAMKQEIDALDVSNPEVLENFLEKYKIALHPKNTHIVQVKYALSQIYGNGAGYELPELPEHLLNRKIELCHELLELADVLTPGMSTFRGLLLYDLQAAMVVQTKRDFENDKLTKQNAQDIMGDAMKLLQEASEILRQEPDMTEELQSKTENLVKELDLD